MKYVYWQLVWEAGCVPADRKCCNIWLAALFWVISFERLNGLNPDKIHVIIGQEAEQVRATFPNESDINWVLQEERLGTGHAVMQAMDDFSPDSRILILLSDAPLITLDTLKAMLKLDCDLGVLSVDMDDPYNYGRIIRDLDGAVTAIIEERDATDEQP